MVNCDELLSSNVDFVYAICQKPGAMQDQHAQLGGRERERERESGISMYIHVCIHIHTYVHAPTHILIYVGIHTYIFTQKGSKSWTRPYCSKSEAQVYALAVPVQQRYALYLLAWTMRVAPRSHRGIVMRKEANSRRRQQQDKAKEGPSLSVD